MDDLLYRNHFGHYLVSYVQCRVVHNTHDVWGVGSLLVYK
jgi:hypothetical protein